MSLTSLASTYVRRWHCLALLLLASLLVALRLLWESLAPLHFSTAKSAMYCRDFALIAPASVLVFAAVSLWPRESKWSVELRARTIVLGSALAASILCYLISRFVLLGVPHVVDEAAYLWQAGLFAKGHVYASTPHMFPQDLIIEYVGDVAGKRFSAFFPGSSVPLMVGKILGDVRAVDPVLAGALVVVTYWSGKRLFSQRVGVIAAVLVAFSPFLLFQGASFFSHVWTALLVIPAVTVALSVRRMWEPAIVGFLLSAALLSRPATALVAGIVIIVHWGVQESLSVFTKRLALSAAAALPCIFMFLGYDAVTTGRWLTTPHRLLLPNESLMFGTHALKNVFLNLAGFAADSSGLTVVGLVLIVWVFGSSKGRMGRAGPSGTIIVLAATELAVYALYYNNGISYGPRYLFEVFPLVMLVAVRGVVSLPRLNARVAPLLLAATAISLIGVLPGRISVFHQRGEYLDLAPVVSTIGNRPAVVLVSAGPYRFPDPFYPAFVSNGIDPTAAQITYVREDASSACKLSREFPSRTIYRLDMSAKAKGEAVDSYLTRSAPPSTRC